MGKKEYVILYRQELKNRILEVAMPLFRQYGIRSVKMDDIAKSLAISKRTLYEIYANKEELLYEGVKEHSRKKEEELQRMMEEGSCSVMDVLLYFFKQQMRDLTEVTPQFFADLNRFPRIIAYIQEQYERHNGQSLAFFERGVEEGYFRKDVDYELISIFANGSIQSIMQSELNKRYDLWYIFRHVILLFMRGFCTEKGLAMIENLLEENNDKSNTF